MAAPSITNALRLRKTLTLFRRIHLPAAPTIAASHSVLHSGVAAAASRPAVLFDGGVQGFMLLRRAAFSSDRFAGESEEIGPDTILFEGCDYNHWLITMDFPKDAKLSPEEMVKTYEETCAKGLGISIEEAKKRMYACSTTTYQGFQAIMTEEESEKFKGIPGVVFILPDSYIDPVNKEYGGDKYENGVITHRPPPVQYRRAGGRFRDHNRNPDQPRFDRQGGSMPNRPQNYGPPGYQQNSGPAQNYVPQQNYGSPGSAQKYPPQQGFGQHGPPGAHRTNYAPQQSFSQPEGPNGCPPLPNYGSQGAPRNYPPPQNYGQQGAPSSYSGQQNYAPPLGGRYPYQPQTRDSVPLPRVDQNQFNSGTQGTYSPAGQVQNYHQNYHQGTEQGYPGETRRNPQMIQGNAEDQQKHYMPVGHSGINQGRY